MKKDRITTIQKMLSREKQSEEYADLVFVMEGRNFLKFGIGCCIMTLRRHTTLTSRNSFRTKIQ